jgi:hypothetical protein
MARNIAYALFLIGTVIWQFSCHSAPPHGCEKHIREKMQPGMSVDAARSELKKCGFKVTLDPAAKTMYGDKVVEGSPISERTQVLVKLGSDDRVASVDITAGLIGP